MKKQKLKVCWISAGVSSFIAGYLAKDVDKFIYIDIDDQHPDSLRFIKDCEKALGREIEILKSSEYNNVEQAIRAFGYVRIARTGFAPCTSWLKLRVRKLWEYDHREYDITYVWGFDVTEKHRAERLVETMGEFEHEFPLISKNLTKEDSHGMLAALGIKRPKMYDLGYKNNNCIGCVKGGMGYWNKIRVDFPEVFKARAKLERDINSKCLKECFLDELEPDRGRFEDEVMQECGILCYLALQD